MRHRRTCLVFLCIMGSQERICGLCLKICNNFQTLKGDMKDVLDRVLPSINFAAIQEFVMCTWCTDILIKCFHFKNVCFYTYDYIVAFVNKDKVKLDLKVIYLSKNENDIGVSEDQVICGFCMALVKNCSAISLDVEEKGFMLEKMIEQCLPGLDLSLIEKPVICTTCFGSLKNYFRFVTNCLLVEEKIKKYCETLDISSRGQIDLNSLLQFTIRDGTTSEMNGNLVGMIQEGKQICEGKENAGERKNDKGGVTFKLERMFCADSENGSATDSNELDGIEIKETFCGEYKAYIKEENLIEMEDQKFLVNEEIDIKTDENDLNRSEDGVVLSQLGFTTMLCKRQGCSVPNVEGDLSCIKHTSTHHNSAIQQQQSECRPSEVTMYNCDICLYETKRKGNLERHLRVHKDPLEETTYKCDSCSYQTYRISIFNKHLLLCKNSLEVTIYKCDSCSYETKRKGNLNRHLLICKNSLELTIYKCDSCSYQTIRKGNLNRHSLLHKNDLEVSVYKCDFCPYVTKHKSGLKNHLLVHRNPSEITMYKCDSCSYQTKRKEKLKAHFPVHKDPSETTMYKCDTCSFQTKYKCNLGNHSLVHKCRSELTIYKCSYCSYQTKYKYSLKKHFLMHKNPSEVTIYRCDFCPFQTKYKSSLKTHLFQHKDP